jgi:high-affinity iron transporter
MAKNLFSVPIFFIVFRETVEAAIIISVLLGLTQQIVNSRVSSTTVTESTTDNQESEENGPVEKARLLKKMKLQVTIPSFSTVNFSDIDH